MPPFLALILCALFVLFILKTAGELRIGKSLSLWLPTLYMFYCASRPISNWLSHDLSGSIEEGSAIDRVFLLVTVSLALLILMRRRFNWAQFFRHNRILVALGVYMAISILWSDYPWVSFKRWIRFCESPIMAMVVLSEPNPAEAIKSVIRRTAYVLIPFSLLLVKYFLDLGVEYDKWNGSLMWVGVTTQKNGLGRLALISAFFLIVAMVNAWPQRRFAGVTARLRTDFIVLLMALFALRGPGGAYSATSIVALFVGVMMYAYLLFAKSHRIRLGFATLTMPVIVVIFLGIAVPVIGGAFASNMLGVLGRDSTFTGRTEIWGAILPVAMRSPIFGCGYGSFWINPPISYNLFFMVNEAHNGYLDVFVELGIIGVFLFVGFVLSTCRKAKQALAYDFDLAPFILCFFLLLLVHNITESSFLRPTSHMAAMMLFLSLLIPRLRKESPRIQYQRSFDATAVS